jgi:hypothetical protein
MRTLRAIAVRQSREKPRPSPRSGMAAALRRLLALLERSFLATSRQVDGVWVAASGRDGARILRRVEEALRLIKVYDQPRFDRLLLDVERMRVRRLVGSVGRFNSVLCACDLDTEFVLAQTSAVTAATIVHEATRARLRHRGIGDDEARRHRVEAICLRRQLAFAQKLPHGEPVREGAEWALALCATPAHWTDAVRIERLREEARDRGLPAWQVLGLLAIHALRARLARLTRAMTRPRRS